jgi:hypothetical protein
LLYWHKRAQFTCFTGTNVLSLLALLAQMRGAANGSRDAQFTCFTGTNVQVLTQLHPHMRVVTGSAGGRGRARRYPVCLLYWYKSTHTDAAAAGAAARSVPSLLALLVQKCKY